MGHKGVCVCALEMLRVAEEEEKSLSSRRGKMKQGFSLSLFKSHTRPLIFMFFYFLFLFGTLSQIGSEWPVFVLGFRPLFFFFFPKFVMVPH
jgi:hypothetical protein